MCHCGEIKLNSCHAERVSASLTKCITNEPLLEERVRVRCLTEREQLEILRSSSINLLQSNSLSLRMTNAIDNLCKGGYAEFISASLACAFGQRFRNKFGMTINHNKSCHPERSEGSLTNCVGINPSPQSSPLGEEEVGGFSHSELTRNLSEKKSMRNFLFLLGVSASSSKRLGAFPSPREEGVGERVQLREQINPSLKIVSFRRMLKDNFSQPYGTQSHKVQLRFTCSASVSLGENSSYSKDFLKKCAFTLAEVLITLGIIGVVAAMTIPTLVSKTTANRYRAQYKKTVATLSKAARLSQSQYDFDFAGLEGTCINPANDNPENVMIICAILNGTLTGASFHYIKDLNMKNGLKYGNNISANIKSGSFLSRGGYMINGGYAYILSDGSLVAINYQAGQFPCTLDLAQSVLDTNPTGQGLSECFGFIDVNGVEGPNKEVSCSSGDDSLDKDTCIVKNDIKYVTDIYPIRFHDGVVEAGSAAARYVLKTTK